MKVISGLKTICGLGEAERYKLIMGAREKRERKSMMNNKIAQRLMLQECEKKGYNKEK